MQNPSKPDWDELARRPGFQALIDAKKRFIVPCCIFFLLYYSALLYLVGWHPELMKKPLIGKVNGAYLFALSQFVMAWIIMAMYVRRAKVFDAMVARLIARVRGGAR